MSDTNPRIVHGVPVCSYEKCPHWHRNIMGGGQCDLSQGQFPWTLCEPAVRAALRDRAAMEALERNHWELQWNIDYTQCSVMDTSGGTVGPVGRGATVREALVAAAEQGKEKHDRTETN